jgi:hypothetical protein
MSDSRMSNLSHHLLRQISRLKSLSNQANADSCNGSPFSNVHADKERAGWCGSVARADGRVCSDFPDHNRPQHHLHQQQFQPRSNLEISLLSCLQWSRSQAPRFSHPLLELTSQLFHRTQSRQVTWVMILSQYSTTERLQKFRAC